MDAHTFYKQYDTRLVEAVCERAGTKLSYFRQIATGHRSPSPKLARALEKASGGLMSKEELLWGSPEQSEVA